MIHGSESGSLDPVLRRYTFLGGKVDLLIFRARQTCLFWCQNGALLWRVDLSFRNSVTGSGIITKCSNILRDKSMLWKFEFLDTSINRNFGHGTLWDFEWFNIFWTAWHFQLTSWGQLQKLPFSALLGKYSSTRSKRVIGLLIGLWFSLECMVAKDLTNFCGSGWFRLYRRMGMCLNPSESPITSMSRRLTAQNWSNLSASTNQSSTPGVAYFSIKTHKAL